MKRIDIIKITLSLFVVAVLFNQVNAQSLDLDRQLGAQNAQMVETQMGIYPDEAMTAYVQEIGARLVAELKDPLFDYQFNIVDDPIPNAFALPGGYIYVTRGILALIKNEDELACVMGHEVIHALNRHSIQQMKSSIFPRLLELPGAIIGNVISEDLGNLLNAPIKTSNDLLLASYSRGHEAESDDLGVQLAAKAGYNPAAMKDILARLSTAVEVLTEEPEKKSYFDDHPFTPDRLSNIDKTMAGFSWTETAKIAEDFPNPIDGLIFGFNPAKGVFKENVFQHPVMKFTLVFPKGWDTDNQPTSVNAMNEDRNAGVFLGLDDPKADMKKLADDFIERVAGEYKVKPTESKTVKINGKDAYLVSFMDNTEKEEMFIHVLWMKIGENMFKLIGLSPKDKQEALKLTAESLREMTDKEIKAMTKKVISVEKVKKGESLEELCKRSNSTLKAEHTAILNGIEYEEKLKQGTRIKVITEVPYID